MIFLNCRETMKPPPCLNQLVKVMKKHAAAIAVMVRPLPSVNSVIFSASENRLNFLSPLKSTYMAWGRVGRSYLLSPSLGIVGSEIPRYCVILSSHAGNLTTQRQALAVSPEVSLGIIRGIMGVPRMSLGAFCASCSPGGNWWPVDAPSFSPSRFLLVDRWQITFKSDVN